MVFDVYYYNYVKNGFKAQYVTTFENRADALNKCLELSLEMNAIPGDSDYDHLCNLTRDMIAKPSSWDNDTYRLAFCNAEEKVKTKISSKWVDVVNWKR